MEMRALPPPTHTNREAQMSKIDGYVTDVEYIPCVCLQQSPVHLNFACILHGFEPVPLDKPFTYFELGFGQGLTVNILAASNPQGRFYGTDFNPAQVVFAQELAAKAGLDNLTLLENSFAELAGGEVELPQFDFITMHGIYTWVNAENRQHIVKFIRRYLKPGGIVYCSYNAMPGRASMLPLQRLWLEYGRLHPGSSVEQFAQARELTDRLADNGAAYFTANSKEIQSYLEDCKTADPRYLSHEYMHDGWTALYFADVARDFAGAKLDFVGSADLPFAFAHCYLTPRQRELLESVPDPVWRETVKDYMRNTAFRSDVFVRGARRMSPARQSQWLERTGIALTVVRQYASLELIGSRLAPEEVFGPVLDALAEGPRTLAELAALPAVQNRGVAVTEIAALLIASNQAAPFFSSCSDTDSAPAHRMNRVVAQHCPTDSRFSVLASPLLGSGVIPGQVPRLVYRVLSAGIGAEQVEDVIAQVWQMILDEGHKIEYPESQPLKSKDEEHAALDKLVRTILELRVPVWRQLGIL